MFGMHAGHAGKAIAIVDIGAGSVGCGVMYLRTGEPSILVASSRAFLSPEERSESQLVTSLAGLLKDTGAELVKHYSLEAQKKYGVPRELYCIIRAPWTHSQTLSSDTASEKPLQITDALIGDMAKKALADGSLDRAALFEAHVARVELNGYPTKKPANKSASLVSIGVLASTVHQELKTQIESALHAVYPSLEPKWRSHTRAAISVLGQLPESFRNCVLVDVTNEGMNILTIRKNLVEKQETMSEGVRALLARLAPGRPEEETLGMLNMLNREACSGPACDAVVAAMGKAEPEIVKLLGETFASLTAVRKLPTTVVLLAHADLTDWLARIFQRIDFAPFTITSQPLEVQTLGARDLGHWIIPDAAVVEDAALSLGGALVHIESLDS